MPGIANPTTSPMPFAWSGNPATGFQPGAQPLIAPNSAARSVIGPTRYAPGYPRTTGAPGNPWADAARSLQDRVNSIWQSMETQDGGPFGGSTSPSVVHPEDQDVQDYLSHVMGSQRKAMDDYPEFSKQITNPLIRQNKAAI
jgi:hypothetical protein